MKYELDSTLRQLLGTGRYGFVNASLNRGDYPVDLAFTLKDIGRYYHPQNESGIPVKRYRSVGEQYNPTRIAAYSLANYNEYLTTGEQEREAIFLQMTEWFMESPSAQWKYDFDWGTLKAPWLSCMAQGEGISVLCRAHLHTGKEGYLEQAVRALEPLCHPVESGGVRSMLRSGEPFLEEYPLSGAPLHTLNGFLYAMIGLVELAAIKPDTAEYVGLPDLASALANNLHLWDLNGWSAYDTDASAGKRNYATLDYHNLHVTQLTYLGHKLSNEVLIDQAKRWQQSATSFLSRAMALHGKVRYRIANPPQR